MSAPTVDDRLARLEARVADLEHRLPPVPRGAAGPPDPTPSPRSEAEIDALWKKLGGDQSPAGPTPLQRMILADGMYDPTVPWGRMEVERMREE